MKNFRVLSSTILIALISVSSFICVGCSSTYRVSDFSSKEKFYEDFNRALRDKTIEVILNNDSTFTLGQGAKVINDTLFSIARNNSLNKNATPVSKIKEIRYKNHWLGLPIYISAGTALGVIVGLTSGYVYDTSIDRNDRNDVAYDIFIGVTAIGTITSGILGWINGYTYTYQFNQ